MPFATEHAILIATVVVLLCISATLSAAETAFFSLTPHSITKFKESSEGRDKAIIRLLSEDEYLLATILIVNNLVNICIVILANSLVDKLLNFGGSGGIEFIVKMVIVTFLLLLFGEIMPKIFASYNSERIARRLARPLMALKTLCKPLSYLLIRVGDVVGRHAGHHANISMDELSNAIEMTANQSAEEKRMLSEIVDFAHTEVVEIMKSRLDIVALDIETNFEGVRALIVQSGFSRIPVYQESIDHIQGVLYVKDLLPYIMNDRTFEWQTLIRKPYFVPEHKKINELLEEFRARQIHMAIVADEYGSTVGLLSLEDILEEIVGEIADESDREKAFYTKLSDNTYLFDGKTHIGDLLEVLRYNDNYLDGYKGEAETIAGLMLEMRKDFLRRGETVTCRNLLLQVDSIEGRRIDKVKITVLKSAGETKPTPHERPQMPEAKSTERSRSHSHPSAQ